MSFSIHVFCCDAQPVTRREIAEFIEEGVYFDKVEFRPPLDSPDSDESEWDSFKVFYDNARVPVVIHRAVGAAVHGFRKVLDGTFFEHEVECPLQIREHVGRAKQVFELEFDRGGGISDECWAMLNCLESHLARSRNGLVFSHEDGVFDANLQLIAGL